MRALKVIGPAAASSNAADPRSDDDLMLLARGGVDAAFDTLVRRHQAAVLMVALRVVGDRGTAEDVAQDAFADLYRALDRYHPEGKLQAYLLRIALNRGRMARRKAWRSRLVFGEVPERAGPAEAEELVLRTERQAELQRAVDALSARHREVVALRFGGGLSHQEMADTLGVPIGTVKSRLFHALRKLRPRLRGFLNE